MRPGAVVDLRRHGRGRRPTHRRLCDEHTTMPTTFGWGHLKVRTTTHDAGHIVTDKDRALAEAVDVDGQAFTSFQHVFVCLHERQTAHNALVRAPRLYGTHDGAEALCESDGPW